MDKRLLTIIYVSNHGGINVFLCEFCEKMYHAGIFKSKLGVIIKKNYIISYVLKISSNFLKRLSNFKLLGLHFKILT